MEFLAGDVTDKIYRQAVTARNGLYECCGSRGFFKFEKNYLAFIPLTISWLILEFKSTDLPKLRIDPMAF